MADAPNSIDPQVAQAHPLFSGKTSVGMISGENPRFPAQASGHQAMGEALKQMGIKHEEREGRYGAPEKSWMLYGPSREQMYGLGKQFGQESVVYSNNGRHELLYTNGPKAGKFHPALDAEWFKHAPEDYYTNMPELGGFLRLNFDWDKLEPTSLGQDAAVQALHDRAAAQQNTVPPQQADREVTKTEIALGLATALRKAIAAVAAKRPEHPLAYDWHNEHTDHHLQVADPGVVLRKAPALAKAQVAHPHMDGSKPPLANEQASTVGTSSYGKFALPYGNVDKGNPSDLTHYPYQGKNEAINNLVKDHGYSTYYAGGKYGRPDLANRNYNTKHLMIYDPSPGSGGDFGHEAYTDGWRKIHELAHALTYPELNQKYGEGRRIGKLGVHRTLREGLRAVHWEWLAAHKQRELGEQIGVHVPDHVFHKELNTVMHDAIHRAVTGKFTEPSGEGFKPHEHKLPLEHALGMVRESAHNLGVTGMHDLIKKNDEGTTTMADDKVLEAKDWRAALAKGLRDRVDAYSKQMLEMRSRELKKNLAADPALAAPTPALKPVDLCPLCNKEDVPGKCMCLQGPLAPAPAAPVQAAPLAQSEMDDQVATPPEPEAGVNKAELEKADDPNKYNHYLVHQGDSTVHGGFEHRQDAVDAAKDHEHAGKLKVMHRSRIAPESVREFHERNGNPEKMHKMAPLDVGQGMGSVGKNEGGALMCSECKMSKASSCSHMAKGERPEVVPQNSEADKKFRADNKAATEAGKKGVPVKPGDGVAKKEFSSEAKAKEPVKAKEGGNGVQIKALKKIALPGTMKGDALQGAHAAGGMPKPAAPAGKMPTPAQHAGRAATFAQHMPAPAAAAPAGAAPKLTGMAKIAAAGAAPVANKLGGAAPKLPGMGAPAGAPKPAGAPPAGTAHLAAPPKPALPGAPKPAGPAAGGMPKPAAPALPKPAAPMGKGESKPGDRLKELESAADKNGGFHPSREAALEATKLGSKKGPAMPFAGIKKSLGNCALCAKPEHNGSCS